MNLIPVGDNIKTIPMQLHLGTVYYKDYGAWRDCLTGVIDELNDSDVPETITMLGNSVFRNRDNLASVNLINIKSVGDYCFYSCQITELNMPELETAGNYAFAYIPIENVRFQSLANPGLGLFYYCPNLKSATFDENIVLSRQMFYQCTNFDTLVLNSNMKVELSYTNTFLGTKIESGEGTIYVPESLLNTYQNDPMWSTISSPFAAIENN